MNTFFSIPRQKLRIRFLFLIAIVTGLVLPVTLSAQTPIPLKPGTQADASTLPETVQVSLPVLSPLIKSNDALPAAIYDQLTDGSGDNVPELTVRYFKPYWYVIYNDQMLVFNRKQQIQSYELPVSRNISVMPGKGSIATTANDFLQLNGNWYVADTYGNRVLKLDANFRLTGTVPFTLPYRLNKSGDDQLKVEHMLGSTFIHLDLNRLKLQPRNVRSTRDAKLTIHTANSAEVYQDPQTGLRWVYTQSEVIIYDPKRREVWQYPTVFNQNAYGDPHSPYFLPYKNEMLLILDHRIERFSRTGKWLSTFPFPRKNLSTIDVHADRNYVFLKSRGTLWMQQDGSVFEINLDQSTITPRFQTGGGTYQKLGTMKYAANAIWFTQNTYHTMPDETPVQLLHRLDVKNGKHQKLTLPVYATLHSVTNPHLANPVFRFNKPDEPGSILLETDLKTMMKHLANN